MPWTHLGTVEVLSGVVRADMPTPPPLSESVIISQGCILLATGLCFQLIGIWRTLQEEHCWRERHRIALEEKANDVEVPDTLTPSAAAQQEEDEDTLGWELMFFPLFASAGLLLMYFFGNILFWLLVGGVCLLTLISVPYVFEPLTCAWCYGTSFRSNSVPAMSWWDVVGGVLGAVIALGWVWTKEWWLHDIVNVCAGITALCEVGGQIKKFKWSTLLLVGLFCYDFFWVYLSSHIFGSNVMLSVATISHTVSRAAPPPEEPTLHLPGTLIFPNTGSVRGYSLLGLGDLVLPGIWVQQCLRFDQAQQRQQKAATEGEPLLGGKRRSMCYVYTILSVVLYVLGLLVCDIVLDVTRQGQPALVFIVPSLVLGTLGTAKCRGDFTQMWG